MTDNLQEEFIELMCKKQPTRVYKYLEAHDNYRVPQCLDLCKRYKLTDATAWLLEKNGQYEEAFSLIKEAVMMSLTNFNKAFLQVDGEIGRWGGGGGGKQRE